MPTPSVNFANQDLRGRVFKNQDLKGTDFSGSDIRGCDFSGALLQAANFERVKAGQTPRAAIGAAVLASSAAVLAANAVSQMVFGAIGQTPAEPGWSFVVALGVSLAIAGAESATWGMGRSQIGQWLRCVPAIASGTLLSFFYAGSAADNNSQVAIAAAAIGAIVTAGLARGLAQHLNRTAGRLAAVSAAVGAVAAYGFAFFVGTSAIAGLSTQRWGLGLVLSLVSAGYLGLCFRALQQTIHAVRSSGVTCFRGADLTDAKFRDADWQNTDFLKAIGWDGGTQRFLR